MKITATKIERKSMTMLEKIPSTLMGTPPIMAIGNPSPIKISKVFDPKTLEIAPEPFPFFAAEIAIKVSEIDVPKAKNIAETAAIDNPANLAIVNPNLIIAQDKKAIPASPRNETITILSIG
jgi:hypothetical protein